MPTITYAKNEPTPPGAAQVTCGKVVVILHLKNHKDEGRFGTQVAILSNRTCRGPNRWELLSGEVVSKKASEVLCSDNNVADNKKMLEAFHHQEFKAVSRQMVSCVSPFSSTSPLSEVSPRQPIDPQVTRSSQLFWGGKMNVCLKTPKKTDTPNPKQGWLELFFVNCAGIYQIQVQPKINLNKLVEIVCQQNLVQNLKKTFGM